MHHVSGMTSAKQNDLLAPEEKNISEIQHIVMKFQTLQSMHELLIM